ncbi:MAG: flagellar biosynthesis protein FlgA, partial [Alphaproteobacteria bacterium]|nr:flagellar biosynthesis protein FlgA [Alphaproteobacteria bacterium]
INFDLTKLNQVHLALRNPDLTTARRVSAAINQMIKGDAATPIDPGTVQIRIPASYPGGTIGLLADVEQLRVNPDQVARVVVDEKSGVIVIGQNVRIDTVAIAQGNLTIKVTETPQVSQPNAFAAAGTTEVVDRTQIEVDEGSASKLALLPGGVSLQELVNGLNALGVGPRDMITILQTIKASGALQAEIEVM